MRARSSAPLLAFVWVFAGLFACGFDRHFAIKRRGSRVFPHGLGDCGDSILPTSLRSIEVWS